MKNLVKILIFASVALWAQTNPLNMTTQQVVKDMGLGINLGNTFESSGSWISNSNGVNAYETAWGSPTVTKAMIDGYASAGFKAVRIPVAWSNLMTDSARGGSYTISTALLNRIDEVVNWVLADNMYAIVNIHWDGGWWSRFPNDSAECMNRYIKMWTQISNKFKDKSGYLVFESLNEEGVWDDVWNQYSGSGSKTRAYGLLNAINQKFTDLVRASGGNNATRHLLIAGYATNIDRTIDAEFKMPTDAQNRRAVSVHYYDPFGFTHLEHDESWATMTTTWGTTQEVNDLSNAMNKLKTNFVDKDIPVIVGEYGVAVQGRAQSEVRKYTLAVAEAIYTRDMCPVLWDVQLNPDDGEVIYYYNRKSTPPAFSDPQLVTGFKNIAGISSSSSSSSAIALSSSSIPSSSSIAASSSSRNTVSSSSSSSIPSSSSNSATPITNHSLLTTQHSLTYYSLKGEPLGNAKPQKAGIYIVKQGHSIQKIVVR